MNTLACGAVSAVLISCAGIAGAASPAPFAVIELFTSEGCSSCPPADALLTRIEDDAHATGQAVFPLEFHVDYWDSQGWRDPYSSAAATDRQRQYAARLGLEQVYTPQMVVNGTSEFVGSNAARAARDITAALAEPARVGVRLEPAPGPVVLVAGAAARYRVQIEPAPRGVDVVVARVESGLVSKVARGENGGRVLRHSSVVRAFAVATPGPGGVATVSLKGAADGHATRIVAFAQDRATGAILGATALTAR